ncbi:tetratricopeptide repeat protein [Candidatus Bathyarchaeota archaeon]|nr:MAG: tetratricopeptide repeat protein [Candidatus Bathyarchaeota archaeon]TMI45425.1 MAG: tetratricopeptide repeat protein [Candidatus Bathyarchaeota archaeon]
MAEKLKPTDQRRLGNKRKIPNSPTHNTLSVILTARGEYQKAEEFSNEAISSSEKIGSSESLAYSHAVRGALYLEQGMLEKAERDLLDS